MLRKTAAQVAWDPGKCRHPAWSRCCWQSPAECMCACAAADGESALCAEKREAAEIAERMEGRWRARLTAGDPLEAMLQRERVNP